MMNDIRDVKPPLDLPVLIPWAWIIWGIVLILLIVVILFLMRRKPRTQKTEDIIVAVPAWEKAYARLEQLKIRKLIERPSLKDFYSELSDIIRRYLEERFSLKAPEMTTEEFLDSLKSSSVLTQEQKKMLKDFLETCDMVKFAKYQPGMAEAQASFDLIKTLISQTHGI